MSSLKWPGNFMRGEWDWCRVRSNVRGTGTNRVPTSNPHGPGASHVSRTPLDAVSPAQLEPIPSHARHQAWFRGAHLPGSLRLSRKNGSGCYFGSDRGQLIIKRAPIAVGGSDPFWRIRSRVACEARTRGDEGAGGWRSQCHAHSLRGLVGDGVSATHAQLY